MIFKSVKIDTHAFETLVILFNGVTYHYYASPLHKIKCLIIPHQLLIDLILFHLPSNTGIFYEEQNDVNVKIRNQELKTYKYYKQHSSKQFSE